MAKADLLTRQLTLLREKGLSWAIRKTLPKLLFQIVALPLALIVRLFGIRFLPVATQRIGHLALELDCYFKEEALGLHPPYLAFLCAPRHLVANQHLLEYWRPFVRLVQSRVLCWLLKPFSDHLILRFEVHGYTMALNQAAKYPTLQRKWTGRSPLLKLSEEDQEKGRGVLTELGVPRDAWFVCVHSREMGYSPKDEHWHSYRNSDIDSYALAMKAIVERGGWCIRVGDPTMKRMAPLKNAIDFAHHERRCDWMDVFLFASCRFFLGNTSGPFLVASVFGVPVACANLVPLGVSLPFGRNDIGIPKLLWSKSENRLLTFEEIFSSELSTARFSSQYSSLGIEVVDNSPDEIAALAAEQLERISGSVTYTEGDEELQRRFKSLMDATHYTFGSESRVGRAFLRKYAYLLPVP
jgi:putative glycosyltransferase (TIGR04372 family)